MPKPATPLIWASGKSFGFQPSSAQQAKGFDYIAEIRPGTGAPITDDHDWPLNQITKAIGWILDSGLGYGSPMIGVPIDWPLAQMPQDIWPDCGMVFLSCAGQSFNKTTYPIAAQLYPSGVMPDLRGEFVRGWDGGRGVDVGRLLLSSQTDSIQSHSHALPTSTGSPSTTSGIWGVDDAAWRQNDVWNEQPTVGAYAGTSSWNGKTPNMANGNFQQETRPRSIAFHKIMRVA